MTDLLNTSLGQYQLIEVIGHGGMSTVYKAHQASLDRFVAVKVLFRSQDPQFIARFKREARAIAHLQHHNILPIFDYNEQDNLLYLVLQYIENGITLADMMREPIEPAAALRLTGHLLSALSYAHGRGVVHRDIKPANILMPSPDWPMLADFGIAKLMNETQHLTMSGLVIGTVTYLAPEQAAGKAIDARTDLYSTGVVLYEMLTGRVPFEGESPLAVLMKHAYEPPPPPRRLNPSLPEDIDTLLLRALAKNPDERFQSAAEMAGAVARIANRIEQSQARTQAANLYRAGAQAIEERRWDAAIESLNQLLAIDPHYEDAAKLLDGARKNAALITYPLPPQIPPVSIERSSQAAAQLSPVDLQPGPSAPSAEEQLDEHTTQNAAPNQPSPARSVETAPLPEEQPDEYATIRVSAPISPPQQRSAELIAPAMLVNDQPAAPAPDASNPATSQPSGAVPARRAALVWALPIVLLTLLAGGGAIRLALRSPATPTSTTSALLAEARSSIATLDPPTLPAITDALPTRAESQPTEKPTAPSTTPPTPEPTLTPTPEPTLTPTAPPTPAPDALVNVAQLKLRSGPGEVYPVVAQYTQGTPLYVLGKDPSGTWLKVQAPDDRVGWIFTEFLQINIALPDVPIGEVPPRPTARPTPRPRPTNTPLPPTPAPAPVPTAEPPTPEPPTPTPTNKPARKPKSTWTPKP